MNCTARPNYQDLLIGHGSGYAYILPRMKGKSPRPKKGVNETINGDSSRQIHGFACVICEREFIQLRPARSQTCGKIFLTRHSLSCKRTTLNPTPTINKGLSYSLKNRRVIANQKIMRPFWGPRPIQQVSPRPFFPDKI